MKAPRVGAHITPRMPAGSDHEDGRVRNIQVSNIADEDDEKGRNDPFDKQRAAGIAPFITAIAQDANGRHEDQPAEQVNETDAQKCCHFSSVSYLSSVCE